MKRLLILSILWLAVFALYGAVASEQEKQTSESKNNQEKSTAESKNEKKIQEFIPSEEVSIDKPVAFPVDI